MTRPAKVLAEPRQRITGVDLLAWRRQLGWARWEIRHNQPEQAIKRLWTLQLQLYARRPLRKSHA